MDVARTDDGLKKDFGGVKGTYLYPGMKPRHDSRRGGEVETCGILSTDTLLEMLDSCSTHHQPDRFSYATITTSP